MWFIIKTKYIVYIIISQNKFIYLIKLKKIAQIVRRLDISYILRNVINIAYERDIMSCFIKLSLINDMRNINERR